MKKGIPIVDEAPPPGVVEHPATPEKLQEEPEPEENHENEAEPNNETAGNYVITHPGP